MAEALFVDAKRLMAAGDFAAACPKLAESNRLDPGSGTLTALAVCHESWGKTATAWAEFIQVAFEARRTGRTDRERFAQQHVAALEPKLSKLTIVVEAPTDSLPGLEVRRDGIRIGAPAWGMAAPLDPGEHTLVVTANGKKTWSTAVTIRRPAVVEKVSVPPLEDLLVEGPGPSPESSRARMEDGDAERSSRAAHGASGAGERTAARASAGGPQRAAGIVIGALGLASAGVGSYFGARALSKSNQANQRCSPGSCTDPGAVTLNHDARTAAVVADVAFGGALVAVGLGAVLYLTAPTGPPGGTALRLLPAVSARSSSLVLDGAW